MSRPRRFIVSLLSAIFLSAGACLLASSPTRSESSKDFLQTIWTTENGLPQNSINAILQTRDGYLWLATFGGLARFDGVNFTTFSSANTPGMKSNRILSLCEGRNGTLWMGTESGEVVSYKAGTAKTYTTSDGLPGGVVPAIKEDRTGVLWVVTANGLARFENGRAVKVAPQPGLPEGDIWGIDEDRSGHLWLTSGKGLVQFDGEKFSTYRPKEGMPEGFFAPFYPRRLGGYWIGTHGGLAHFDQGTFVLSPDIPKPPTLKMRTLMEDRDGTIWISGTLGAALRYANGKCTRYPLKSGTAVVRAMYQDREDNLWMGSDGGGLVKLARRRVTTYTTDDGLPSNNVHAVTDDGADGFWITTSGGLVHWRAGKFVAYRDRVLSYATSLYRDRAGKLWVGSDLGLTRFEAGRLTHYKDGLAHPWVRAILEDRDGTIWVGTSSGLHRLREGKFDAWRRADGLVNEDVRNLVQTADGAIWVGTSGGLSRFKDGAFTNYTTRNGLSNDYVRDIVEDADGGLWLATYGGGLTYLQQGRFVSITTQHGLFDDFISRLLVDSGGDFWLLGNRGIARVSRRQLNDFVEGRIRMVSPVTYGISDGMESSEGNGGNQPAGWNGADGRLWFPTIKGLAVVNPGETNALAPPVVIEQAILDGKPLPLDQPVRIRPGQENLEIRYTALTFSRPERARFTFQLVGLDQDWIDAGSRRTAYYSHLPPGGYTFRLTADNGDGVWNHEGATLRVLVALPYWRTWWFLFLVVAAIGATGFWAVHYRVSRLERAQAEQQAFTRQLIASQENERKRIAAELHDSLGQRLIIIKNRALLLLQTPANAAGLSVRQREQIEEISSEVSGAVREVKEVSYNLRPYRLDRLGLTAALRALIDGASAASATAFSTAIDDIDDILPKNDEINFYRIVQECVNNILKHSQAAHAVVHIRRSPKCLILTVQDDGKGFAPDSVHQDSLGFGLTGISERAQLLGGKAAIHSALGQGTTVTIEISSGRLNHSG